MNEKIKKLLALSNGTHSDHESYSALQKAQALMAEYKISEKDLSTEKIKKCIQWKTNFSYGSSSSDLYLCTLAHLIADNFCCVSYSSRVTGTRTNYVCLMGYPEDIDIAVEALTTANAAIIRGYNRVWKNMCKTYKMDYIPAKYFNPAKVGYIEGYIDGLKSALDSQKEQNQEWGLVLVAPKEAEDFLSSLSSVTRKGVQSDSSYYDDGYRDGASFNMNKKITDENRLKLS